MPALSIIIPTYNRSGTLPRAVASALGGGDPDVEVIVVDDGSADETARAMARFEDARLHFIRREEHVNGNVARNAGVSASGAPLLAFLDSDDAFLPGRARRLIEFFARRPEIDAVHDSFRVVIGDRERMAAVGSRTVTGEALVDLLVAHAIPLTCSAIAMRRAAFDAVGGFDEGLSRQQDRDLLLRLARGHTVALGTGGDVVKYQSADSFSRGAANHADGLDALVARHPVFREPRNRGLLAYLTARMALKALASGDWAGALGEARAIGRARHLPGLAASLLLYGQGRRLRRRSENALSAGERR